MLSPRIVSLSLNIVPAKPSVFDPSSPRPVPARTWLLELQNYFKAVHLVGAERVNFAIAHLRGPAVVWLNSIPEQSAARTSWDEFERQFLANYQPLSDTQLAREQLFDLTQTGTVTEYNNTFRTLDQLLQPTAPMDEVSKITLYIRGLKVPLRRQLHSMIQRQPFSTVNEAMSAAQRAEAFQQQLERDSQRGRQRWSNPRPVWNVPARQCTVKTPCLWTPATTWSMTATVSTTTLTPIAMLQRARWPPLCLPRPAPPTHRYRA